MNFFYFCRSLILNFLFTFLLKPYVLPFFIVVFTYKFIFRRFFFMLRFFVILSLPFSFTVFIDFFRLCKFYLDIYSLLKLLISFNLFDLLCRLMWFLFRNILTLFLLYLFLLPLSFFLLIFLPSFLSKLFRQDKILIFVVT
jgi:hypothetical protein